ncbi:MAG: hypothetical protein RPU52_08105 [Candidatus Sedimenticola sp. (ex Thyasira tokunagai)]
MKARYIKIGEYKGPHMTIGQVYEVIGIEANDYRIINNEKQPYLYNPEQFEIVDPNKPLFWVTEIKQDTHILTSLNCIPHIGSVTFDTNSSRLLVKVLG